MKISVIGLGYVGLPLALALAKHFEVIGFDVAENRVNDLRNHLDHTNEVAASRLRESTLHVTDYAADMAGSDVFIVTVPTPVDADKKPDLGALELASQIVGGVLRAGAIVVYESTVYPGVTEDVCGPILAEASNLKCGEDFFLGYSPERMNPGDKEHTVERITKVLAGQTPAVTEILIQMYGAINGGKVFAAVDIRTAEAAKVLENAQRDINIAFINELAIIFSKLDLSIHDVLDAARTKWNFLKFEPGLVGGHCIGVDPFYLAHISDRVGHHPEIILSGRRINDGMATFFAEQINGEIGKPEASVLMLGLTFKENVADLRNSKAGDLQKALSGLGHSVTVCDPLANPEEAKFLYGIDLITSLDGLGQFDCIVGVVPHRVFCALNAEALQNLLMPDGLLADIKAIWRNLHFPSSVRRWNL